MEIITRKRVESLEDYIAQNLDSDGGLSVEIDGVEVRVSQQWECPLDCGDALPTFLNLLKGYEFGTMELREHRGVNRITKRIIESELRLYRGLIDELNAWLDGSFFECEVDGDYIETSFSVCELAERIEAELARIQQKEIA